MRSCAVLVGLLTLTACRRPGPAHSHAAEGPDTAALARGVPDFLRMSGVPGLSMAVVRDGRLVWAAAFGTRDDSAQTPVDTATVPLTPMTERLFEVAAEPTTRVRFDDAGSRGATRIAVLYSDGTTDQAIRLNEPRRHDPPGERARRGGGGRRP